LRYSAYIKCKRYAIPIVIIRKEEQR